ncbi:efflux RND transporter periplasmic adaptor subunit [Litorimonas sp. RW-G-Af-16]|uniref:efflux RND transporter periplasmic adaptor subunit n=1 Tax=Litorimonas sp. RW-G-Af-16 TaxID=3241168 RepID=UPI00390C94E9
MKFNKSYLISAILLTLIALWFLINAGGSNKAETEPATRAIETETAVPDVVVETFRAQEHPNRFRLYGRTAPNREVAIKAETAGLIAATPVTEGKLINRGTVICRQDVDARKASLDQAKANLVAREADYNSTKALVDKGFSSAIQLASLKAAVDGARASVTQAEIELDNVKMRAPFRGIFDQRMAEVGDYLLPGQPCGMLVELDPLIVAIDLSETQVGKVELGQEIDIELVTGETLIGKLAFIEAKANSGTRTFRSEIHVPNKDYKLKGGVTADVSLLAGMTLAQRIPGKILTLDDAGSVGVRYVDTQNIVRFANVEVIDEDGTGIWVTGLPNEVRVITEGENFVSVGTTVNPRGSIYTAATQ